MALGRVAFSFATIGMSGQLNDFYAYWAAGVLLNRGEDPYNVAAVPQAAGDGGRETVYQASPSLAWLSSVGLFGALILGGLTAYVLLRSGPSGGPGDRHADYEAAVDVSSSST